MNFRRILGGTTVLLLLLGAHPGLSQTITNVTPPLGAAGDGPIFLDGNGFSAGTLTVTFNGTVATLNTGVVGPNRIQTQVPNGATTGFIWITNNGHAARSPNQFVITSTNAYITNFTPVFNNSADVVVSGIHFSTITNVLFNGVLSKKTGSTPNPGPNQITVTPPDGVTTGPLIVMSSSGSSHNFSSISNAFNSATNYFATPTVTSFSPATGRPTTNVLIQGTSFTGASGVLFGGVNASSFTVLSNTAIQATVPTNAPTAIIEVTSPFTLSGSSSTTFRMLPTLSSFSPTIGGVGTIVVITGANLNEVASGTKPTVSFNGLTATVGAFGFNTITSTVPASPTSGFIAVQTTNGWTTNTTQLFYAPASISSFTPTNGSNGTIVKITGVNFTNASAVSFNGIPSTDFSVTNNTTIGAKAPNGVTSGTISVTTPAGTATSTTLFYVAPTITDFTPTHGLPGTNVVITGTSFTNTSAVLFNGIAASSFQVMNNTTLSAVVSNNTTTGKITVIAPGGTNSSTNDFVIDTTDLGVSVKDSPDPVFIGSNLVYTITITNLSAFVATNVKLTNSLPSSVTLKSASTSQGTLTTNVTPIYGTLGTINNGGSATVTLTVAPTATGSITNSALVTSDSLDSNLSNNTNSAVTTVWPLPFLSITNLMTNELVKISWPAPLSNFTLQFRTDLSTSVQWTNDSGAKVLSGTNVSVTETNIGTARFFRLTN